MKECNSHLEAVASTSVVVRCNGRTVNRVYGSEQHQSLQASYSSRCSQRPLSHYGRAPRRAAARVMEQIERGCWRPEDNLFMDISATPNQERQLKIQRKYLQQKEEEPPTRVGASSGPHLVVRKEITNFMRGNQATIDHLVRSRTSIGEGPFLAWQVCISRTESITNDQ